MNHSLLLFPAQPKIAMKLLAPKAQDVMVFTTLLMMQICDSALIHCRGEKGLKLAVIRSDDGNAIYIYAVSGQ